MEALILGLTLGFAAGISPGPLLTLVITSTLQRGFGAGARVALAPLLTDVPIIVLTLLVLRELSAVFLQGISVFGGLFVVYLGIKTIRDAAGNLAEEVPSVSGPTDVLRGLLVNVLSPHPWLFWVSVGGPILVKAWAEGPAPALTFLIAFLVLIVGGKVFAAGLVASGRRFLEGLWYRRLLTGAGAILIILGASLVWQGLYR